MLGRIGIFIGLYSYTILLLGLLNVLSIFPVIVISILSIFIFFRTTNVVIRFAFLKNFLKLTVFQKCLVIGITLMALVNLVGALGPELAFDALWYHLTMPKLFVQNHSVYFIRDSLFYYSLQPKLAEMLYSVSLILGNEILAKLVHFSFGLLTAIALYKLSKIYLSKYWSFIVVIVFYSNLVVSWLSTTAYTDLVRTFYETAAFLYFALYFKTKKKKYFYLSSILLGFAIAAKLVSLGSVVIFILLIMTLPHLSIKVKIRSILFFNLLSLSVCLPWFLISFLNTQNPFYPVLSDIGPQSFEWSALYPLKLLSNIFETFLYSSDPISPIYLIMLPLIFFIRKKISSEHMLLVWYSVFAIAVWYILTQLNIWHDTSAGGSARFLTAYLPALSLLCVIVAQKYCDKFITRIFTILVVVVLLISIAYRGMANAKYVPVILGIETKQDFLLNNLNFNFGDFYDEDKAIKNIVGRNVVLLINMHNLYYVNFPFTLTSDGMQKPTYILVQNANVPVQFAQATLVYENFRTHVKLYKL